MNQSKQIQELKTQIVFLNDSIAKLTTKVDSIATHNKMLETPYFSSGYFLSNPWNFSGPTWNQSQEPY